METTRTMTTLKKFSLFQAILQLKTEKECAAFFSDLCTPSEMAALNERWLVTQILDQKKLSYREISKETKASLTTIGRVARFLTQESYQGYRLVLDKLKKKKENHAKT